MGGGLQFAAHVHGDGGERRELMVLVYFCLGKAEGRIKAGEWGD